MTTVLDLSDVRLTLPISGVPRTILRGVDLRLGAGEALGLVGESGSGKSMLLRSVLRWLPEGASVTGSLHFEGRDLLGLTAPELREVRATGIGIVFQDPRSHVNPLVRLGDFLTEALRDRGVRRRTAEAEVTDLLRQVRIAEPQRVMAAYPHEVSGGMLQRVMIAAALSGSPRLLLADEPTTALDARSQREVVLLLEELRRRHDLAMLFVTHDLELAAATCDRTAVMYAGAVVEVQPSDRLLEDPRHPYTRALLASRPRLTGEHRARLDAIAGSPAPPYLAGDGCAFAPRCPARLPVCDSDRPALLPAGPAQLTACHLVPGPPSGTVPTSDPVGARR